MEKVLYPDMLTPDQAAAITGIPASSLTRMFPDGHPDATEVDRLLACRDHAPSSDDMEGLEVELERTRAEREWLEARVALLRRTERLLEQIAGLRDEIRP